MSNVTPYTQRSAGFLWGMLSQSQKEDVLRNAAKRAAHIFAVKVEAYKRATGLRKPAPREQLAIYRARSPERWAVLQAGLPRIYARQVAEWQDLEARAARGELA
jgi:hypothetical protein